jgi:histone-lysine N-methyltransferase SETD2
MSSSVSIDREVVDDLNKRWAEEVEMINQQFSTSNNYEKLMLLKRLREMTNPTTSFLIEPEVKLRKRGKRVKHNEVGTRRFPCAHELVESELVNNPATAKSARRPKEKVSLI